MSDCSEYVYGEVDPSTVELCRCPICQGFLPRDFPLDKPFTCKKCKTELMTFPHVDEDSGKVNEEYGKICPISKPTQFAFNQDGKKNA